MGFPCSSVGKESVCSARDPGLYPWVGKIPWRRKLQPTPVSLSVKSHRQRSLVGCRPWGRKESGTTEWLTLIYLLSQILTLCRFAVMGIALLFVHLKTINSLNDHHQGTLFKYMWQRKEWSTSRLYDSGWLIKAFVNRYKKPITWKVDSHQRGKKMKNDGLTLQSKEQ